MTTTTHTTATGLGASGRTWRLDELLNEAGVQTLDGARVPAVAVRSLTDDSRRVGPGACFVAVPGSRQDGHVHIPAAVRAGATAIICSQCPSGPPVLQADGAEPVAVVPVCDARDALAQLAVCWWRVGPGQERALPLIGITGTNGKTTVAWMLRSILRAAGLRPALMGTIEYDLVGRQCAAPLTTPGAFALAEHLAEAADAGATHAVLEVSSHALHQRRTDGLGFAAGVFTNLSGDHLDYHGSMEAYFEAKSRLFLGERAAGTAVVNGDDPAGRRLQRAGQVGQRMVSYGLTSMGLDVTGRVVERTAAGTRFVAEGLGEPVRVSLPMVGEHNVYNALAAAVTASSLGVALDAVVAGLEGLAVVPGRLERVTPVDSPFAVFVDYAHTDDALDHVLAVLRRVTTGRLICVFGCGGDRDRSKRPRMAAAVAEHADLAIVTNDNPRSEDPQAIADEIVPGFAGGERACPVTVELDRRSAIGRAIAEASAGDTVLIAGKGHETYQLLGTRVLDFDDRAVARAHLAPRAAEMGKGEGAA